MSFWSRLFGFETKDAPPDGAKTLTINGSGGVTWDAQPWDFPMDWWSVSSTVPTTIYRRQPAVRTVVDFLARNIGQLNPKVYERVGDDDRVEHSDHRLAALLRQPNPQTTRFRHLRDTVADIAIYDRAFWVKVRGRGSIQQLVRQSPAQVIIESDQRTGSRVFRLLMTGQVISRDDLVIFSGYSPDGTDLGVSPMETLRRVLAEETAAVDHRENFWRNAARQAGTIERPLLAPPWDDVSRKRFREGWQSSMAGGANAGKTAVLEEGMHWNGASFSPKESEYIAGRKLTYEEVALAYGGATLAALVVGQGADVKSNVEAFHRQLYQDVLGPWLRMLQDEIELQLLPEFDDDRQLYVEFNLAEKLKGSFEEQATVITTSVGVPWMTINEARALRNLPRVDDPTLDVPVKPMNVMYGNQPAVTVPTEDPSTPPGLASAYRRLLQGHVDRLQRSVSNDIGRGKSLDVAWQTERWNKELTNDLFLFAQKAIYDAGKPLNVISLTEWSRDTAEQVNAITRDHLAKALEWGQSLEPVFTAAAPQFDDLLPFALTA